MRDCSPHAHLGSTAEPHGGASGFLEGVTPEQLACARTCLGLQLRSFERGEEIVACTAGHARYGVLDSGLVLDVRRYPDGERSLVDVIEPGDLFGEGWRAGSWGAGEPPRERAAIGSSPGSVLLLDAARLADPDVVCLAKPVIQNNLLQSVLHKQERLRAKIEILRHRSLRARIASYLLVEARRRGARHLTLPLTRTLFAEYLHADRAAVSRELSRMRDDGLIDYHRNSFVLLSS
jgi:CRP-like cAMP-binding protein